jgi:group I intron endonuclease
MTNRNKELKQQYKERKQKVGIYSISFNNSETIFVGNSKNLEKAVNRHIFTLKLDNHKCNSLQEEWNKYGSENLIFQVLEEIETEEINTLLLEDIIKSKKQFWITKLNGVDIF